MIMRCSTCVGSIMAVTLTDSTWFRLNCSVRLRRPWLSVRMDGPTLRTFRTELWSWHQWLSFVKLYKRYANNRSA